MNPGLGAEDHLRCICLHLLKHGGLAATLVCDVGAALDYGPLISTRTIALEQTTVAEWIACVLALAKQLLGAELRDAPVEGKRNRVPGWLLSAVRKQWSGTLPATPPFIWYSN